MGDTAEIIRECKRGHVYRIIPGKSRNRCLACERLRDKARYARLSLERKRRRFRKQYAWVRRKQLRWRQNPGDCAARERVVLAGYKNSLSVVGLRQLDDPEFIVVDTKGRKTFERLRMAI